MSDPLRSLARRLRRGLARRGASAASYEDVERAERIFYLEYLRDGMIVFDVGAHVGELTLLFSRFVVSGHVHAFEATRDTFNRLSTITRAAGRRNVTLNHTALAESEESLTLNIYEEGYSAWNSRAARPLADYGIDVKSIATEEVEATTVDIYCERGGITKIDLLKIDVEGAEHQVLLGARRMLESKAVGCVAFEFGQTTFDMGNRPEEIEAYLTGLGYVIRNVVKGNQVFPGRARAATAQFSMHVATLGR
ncbi:MAG: hypothetical protein QOF61_591 [Acidobacteriota bacterium]|nr:hypothetical protein [Acidobacteriota bacterium]